MSMDIAMGKHIRVKAWDSGVQSAKCGQLPIFRFTGCAFRCPKGAETMLMVKCMARRRKTARQLDQQLTDCCRSWSQMIRLVKATVRFKFGEAISKMEQSHVVAQHSNEAIPINHVLQELNASICLLRNQGNIGHGSGGSGSWSSSSSSPPL